MVTRSVYVAVLAKDQASPLAPESDEGKGKEEKKEDKDKGKEAPKDAKDNSADKESKGADKDKEKEKDKKEEPVVVKIDFEGLSQRILALPIPARNYVNLSVGKTGVLFASEGPQVITEDEQENLPQTLSKWDLEKRKFDKFLDGVNDYAVSFDGGKILYRKGDQWAMVGTAEPPSSGGGPPKPGEGPLKLDAMEVYVEPRAMWKQIYNETWRIERDFFYDTHYHGLDLDKAKKKYAPSLDGIASREELTYLFQECLGEMTVGHMFVGGGEAPEPKKLKGGLLGADYSLENGRYRVAKVYNGENWNPGNEAPL